MASRKKVVFRDDGTIVETPDDEEQDASSQVLTTPRTTELLVLGREPMLLIAVIEVDHVLL